MARDRGWLSDSNPGVNLSRDNASACEDEHGRQSDPEIDTCRMLR
jgi:hypothetical protein